MICIRSVASVFVSGALVWGISMSHLQAADPPAADTVESAPCIPTPNADFHLTVGRHFKRFAKATFDWKTVVSPAATAEVSQISPWHAGFANNSTGYLQHYRDSVIGNVSGKFWGTFLLPSLFKQNEKFKPTGPGATFSNRVVHVLTHSLFAASSADNRSTVFNVGAMPATALNALLSDVYLPRQQRTVSSTFGRFGLGMAVFVAGDAYQEFRSLLKRGAVTTATLGMVKQPPAAVDYAQLTPAQQDLLKTAGQQWTGLSVSQQIEYVAVTHALDNWCKYDSACSRQPDHAQQPGLSEVKNLIDPGITGSVPGAKSENQFNLAVAWDGCSEEHFKTAFGWTPHDSLLHPGHHGYEQAVAHDPFLGVVVLFRDGKPLEGQIHIDFREGAEHYYPSNGDAQENYPVYCGWYGAMEGYNVPCPGAGGKEAKQGPALAMTAPQVHTQAERVQPPPPGGAPAVASPRAPQPALPQQRAEIQPTVEAFLKAWYVDRDFDGLTKYVATDNEFTAASASAGQPRQAPLGQWDQVFQNAFKNTGGRIRKLADAIDYPKLAPDIGAKFLNANPQVRDLFAIIDPGNPADGRYFPPTQGQTTFDAWAQFLDHLRNANAGRITLVIYVTKSSALVREGVVLYWILESSEWKLAAFRAIY